MINKEIRKPEGWFQKKLGEVAKLDRQNIKPEFISSGTLYIGLEHINNDGGFNDFQLVEPGELASNKFSFTKNHILYGKLRPYLKKIARPDFSGICSTDIIPIIPSQEIDKDFLFYCLRQPQYIDLATTRSSGANLPRISPKELEKFPIVFPPIAQQKRIAAILDKADAVRRKRREAIRLTEELLRSTFLEMFGDPVTNPKGWDVVNLGSLLQFLTTGSRGWAKYYCTHGDLFLRIQNVKNCRLKMDDITYVDAPDSVEAKRILVQAHDVLLSMTADLGRTAVIPQDFPRAYVNQHLAILRPDYSKILSTYLAFFIESDGGKLQINSLNRQGVKAGLNFDDVRSLKILLPPLSIQQKFNDFFALSERKICHLKTAYSESENLFNSLLQRAFTGNL